jgi:hypothetical protein
MEYYDFDREAAYGKSYIDPDIRQELQIKFVFSIQRFNVAEHLAQVPTPLNSRFCRNNSFQNFFGFGFI